MSEPMLLWRDTNTTTVKALRGLNRGQYHVALGSGENVARFLAGVPRVLIDDEPHIEIWTHAAPDPGGGELPPWRLRIKRMGPEAIRKNEWRIASQQPGSGHPIWQAGAGAVADPEPDAYLLLLRTGGARFFAGWLRAERLGQLPKGLRGKIESRPTDVAGLDADELAAVLGLLGQPGDAAASPAVPGLEEPTEEPAVGRRGAREGQPVVAQHTYRERSPRLRRERIEMAGERPLCEACGFDFQGVYGERGEGFIECHHLVPLAELERDPSVPTELEDLALLCPNCHRMIHVRPLLTVEQLTSLLAEVASGE